MWGSKATWSDGQKVNGQRCGLRVVLGPWPVQHCHLWFVAPRLGYVLEAGQLAATSEGFRVISCGTSKKIPQN